MRGEIKGEKARLREREREEERERKREHERGMRCSGRKLKREREERD